MLVPAMQSIGTCSSSSTFSTPTCAPPFAPPPASTRPTRGRRSTALALPRRPTRSDSVPAGRLQAERRTGVGGGMALRIPRLFRTKLPPIPPRWLSTIRRTPKRALQNSFHSVSSAPLATRVDARGSGFVVAASLARGPGPGRLAPFGGRASAAGAVGTEQRRSPWRSPGNAPWTRSGRAPARPWPGWRPTPASTSAAFCCVSSSSCITALFTCSMPADCSFDAAAISATMSVTFFTATDDLAPASRRTASPASNPRPPCCTRVLDQRLDLLGGRRRAAREVAHFGGDHGESAALLTGARGFHRGVQRQQIGLESDPVDHADDVRDLLRGVVDADPWRSTAFETTAPPFSA